MDIDPNGFWYEATFNFFKINDMPWWFWRSIIPIGSTLWLLIVFLSYWVSLGAGILLDAIKLAIIFFFDSGYKVEWTVFGNLIIYHTMLVFL